MLTALIAQAAEIDPGKLVDSSGFLTAPLSIGTGTVAVIAIWRYVLEPFLRGHREFRKGELEAERAIASAIAKSTESIKCIATTLNESLLRARALCGGEGHEPAESRRKAD